MYAVMKSANNTTVRRTRNRRESVALARPVQRYNGQVAAKSCIVSVVADYCACDDFMIGI